MIPGMIKPGQTPEQKPKLRITMAFGHLTTHVADEGHDEISPANVPGSLVDY